MNSCSDLLLFNSSNNTHTPSYSYNMLYPRNIPFPAQSDLFFRKWNVTRNSTCAQWTIESCAHFRLSHCSSNECANVRERLLREPLYCIPSSINSYSKSFRYILCEWCRSNCRNIVITPNQGEKTSAIIWLIVMFKIQLIQIWSNLCILFQMD